MNLRQAAQQALEALEALKWKGSPSFVKDAIAALKQALAEPDQQPVAWMESPHGVIRANPLYRIKAPQSVAWSIPLYASAPTPRKPLSEEEIHNIYLHMTGKAEGIAEANGKADFPVLFARALEQMHGIGD